jgi:SAM-dependent methyltransferase
MDHLLEEQVRYYRKRAPEYDATSPQGGPFADITAMAVAELRALGPVEHAIELGAGTGQFTGVLAELARRVTAVDTSPEVLELNAAKVPASNVERVVGDAFDWRPSHPAEIVMFGALLSHIPRERFATFWGAVAEMLAPGGSAFVIDESPHGLWQEEYTSDAKEIAIRTLRDGRRFRIVKVLWATDELASALRELNWDAQLTRHDPFYWGTVRRKRRTEPGETPGPVRFARSSGRRPSAEETLPTVG